MLTVFAALIPVFLLIVLGFVLRKTLLKHEATWSGLEQLVYYVLFPALLVDSLGRADLASVPIAGAGGSLSLSVLIMSALCMAIRPLLMDRMNVSGPAFSSLFQGATRWQTFVALSVSGSLWGTVGLTLASVAMVAMIPILNAFCAAVLVRYASPEQRSLRSVFVAIALNPLVGACLLGIFINLAGIPFPQPAHQFADSLGRCSLAIALLVVGAGLRFEGLRQSGFVTAITVVLKLIVMPVTAIALAKAFGLTGTGLAVVACCSSVPSASNSYILARQMGGDAPLMAQILTIQTGLALFTMPLFIAYAS